MLTENSCRSDAGDALETKGQVASQASDTAVNHHTRYRHEHASGRGKLKRDGGPDSPAVCRPTGHHNPLPVRQQNEQGEQAPGTYSLPRVRDYASPTAHQEKWYVFPPSFNNV